MTSARPMSNALGSRTLIAGRLARGFDTTKVHSGFDTIRYTPFYSRLLRSSPTRAIHIVAPKTRDIQAKDALYVISVSGHSL